jgi:hypothetical protein
LPDIKKNKAKKMSNGSISKKKSDALKRHKENDEEEEAKLINCQI